MKKPLLLSLLFLLPFSSLSATEKISFEFYFFENKKDKKYNQALSISTYNPAALDKRLFYEGLGLLLKKNSSGNKYNHDELKENFDITIDKKDNRFASIFDIQDEAWSSLLGDNNIHIRPKKPVVWFKVLNEGLNWVYPVEKDEGTMIDISDVHQFANLPNHTTIKPSQRNSGILKKLFTGDDTTTSNKAFYAKLAGGAIIIVLGGLGLIQLTYKSKKSKPKSTKKHPKT